MARCENCLHYGLCVNIESQHLRIILSGDKAERCRYFKSTAEVAREIFEEIEKALSDNFHADCQMGDCIEDYYDENLRDDIAELKKKYTEENDDQ